MVIILTVGCKSDTRQGKDLICKGRKSETTMAHKNKTQKYSVDT